MKALISGAELRCTCGSKNAQLIVDAANAVFFEGEPAATEADFDLLPKVEPFGKWTSKETKVELGKGDGAAKRTTKQSSKEDEARIRVLELNGKTPLANATVAPLGRDGSRIERKMDGDGGRVDQCQGSDRRSGQRRGDSARDRKRRRSV